MPAKRRGKATMLVVAVVAGALLALATGYVRGNHLENPFLWTRANGFARLETFGGVQTAPGAINNRGQISGWAHIPGMDDRTAVIWNPGGDVESLGSLAAATESYAEDINEDGWGVVLVELLW